MQSGAAKMHHDVAVVGGGVAGAAVAWFAAQAGARVLWLTGDDSAGSATWVSGGMLAPKAEGLNGAMLALGRRALAAHEPFTAAVEAAADTPIHRGRGMWLPAIDGDPVDWLLEYAERRRDDGDAVVIADRAAWPTVPPAVALAGTIAYPDEGWVDPRGLQLALRAALADHRSVAVVAQRATEIGAAAGVITTDSTTYHAAFTVIAAGHLSGAVAGIDWPALGPMWSDRGLMLRLADVEAPPGVLYRHDPRGTTYVVPDPAGVRLGSISVPHDTQPTARAGELAELLGRGVELWPPLADARLTEAGVGWRPCGPGSGDVPLAAPIHHCGRVWGLLGLERNGILLAPLLAAELVAALAQGKTLRFAAPTDAAPA